MTLVLEFPSYIEKRLRINAALHGKDITEYMLWLVEDDALTDFSGFRDEADFEESVAGIRAGLADLEAGRTISLEELSAELAARRKARKAASNVEMTG